MKNPTPRIQMLDGFNEGWTAFEGDPGRSLKGTIELDTVIKGIGGGLSIGGQGLIRCKDTAANRTKCFT